MRDYLKAKLDENNLPSIDEVQSLVSYNPDSGIMTWKARPLHMFETVRHQSVWNARFSGTQALNTSHKAGYKYGSIFRKKLLAHRVAWAIHHGKWPEDQIDHINGNPSDNRISNLRSVSNCENGKNTKLNSRNTSGHIGVSWHKQLGKWTVRIGKKHLGVYPSFEAAVKARQAEQERLGYHPNHGRKS